MTLVAASVRPWPVALAVTLPVLSAALFLPLFLPLFFAWFLAWFLAWPDLWWALWTDRTAAVRLAPVTAGLASAGTLWPKKPGWGPSPDPIPPHANPPTMTATTARRINFPPGKPR